MGVYHEVFSQFANQYDAIFHFSLGAEFSSSYQNAYLAAQSFSNVRVIDSQSLCCGQGMVAMKALELAPSAPSLDELEAQLNDFKHKMDGRLVIDKMDYVAKGGRCSSATALGANLLNLKPCIELKDGKMSVGKKYRGNFDKVLLT